jgi:hypothetical protein
MFTSRITKSRYKNKFFYLQAGAMASVNRPKARVYSGPTNTAPSSLCTVCEEDNPVYGRVLSPELFSNAAGPGILPALPLQLGDIVEYDVRNGDIYLIAIRRGAATNATVAGASTPGSVHASKTIGLNQKPHRKCCGANSNQANSNQGSLTTSFDVYKRVWRWYRDNVGLIRPDNTVLMPDHSGCVPLHDAEQSRTLIKLLPRPEKVTTAEIYAVMREVLMGHLEWGFHHTDKVKKMSEYAKVVMGADPSLWRVSYNDKMALKHSVMCPSLSDHLKG